MLTGRRLHTCRRAHAVVHTASLKWAKSNGTVKHGPGLDADASSHTGTRPAPTSRPGVTLPHYRLAGSIPHPCPAFKRVRRPPPRRPYAQHGRANPISNHDPSGHWVESAIDIGFIAYDIYDIRQNGLTWGNGLSLVADVGGLVLPLFTGGGLIVRGISHADDAADALRAASTVDNVSDATSIVSDTWAWGKTYQKNYTDYYKIARDPGYQVHHVFPQRFADTLAEVGINVHDPNWLREVPKQNLLTGEQIHQRLYTEAWQQWADRLGHTPTAEEIVGFARQLEAEYATEGTLFYREGTDLPGLIDWSKLPSSLP